MYFCKSARFSHENHRLCHAGVDRLQEHIGDRPEAAITYFVPDSKKGRPHGRP